MYQTIILSHFRKQLKRYLKKYRHLKNGVITALENFSPARCLHIGNQVYKIRIITKDLNRGKSKSFRLLVLVVEVEHYLVPITLYFKGDRANITEKELNAHLEMILWELRSVK